VVSATEWENFFELRIHEDAEVHFQKLATLMKGSIDKSTPRVIVDGEWHLPFISGEEKGEIWSKYADAPEVLKKVSAGRCARVSYLTHDGKRDFDEDVKLFEKMAMA